MKSRELEALRNVGGQSFPLFCCTSPPSFPKGVPLVQCNFLGDRVFFWAYHFRLPPQQLSGPLELGMWTQESTNALIVLTLTLVGMKLCMLYCNSRLLLCLFEPPCYNMQPFSVRPHLSFVVSYVLRVPSFKEGVMFGGKA